MSYIQNESIRDRSKNWKHRIKALYEQISRWLEDTPYTFAMGKLVKISGQKDNVDGLEGDLRLPTANILRKDKLKATLKPKGLWTIGASGRIDLLNESKRVIIFDKSDHSDDSPDWKIEITEKTTYKKPLNRENFLNILDDL